MKNNILLFILSIFLVACGTENNRTEEASVTMRKDFYGVWQGVSLKVNINAGLDIADSVSIFEIQEQQWEKTLSVKPVLTYYFPDSTYRQEFIALDGVVYDSIRGLWNVIGDTLILISPQATYQYKFKINEGLSEYKGYIDWDSDGQEDDEYVSIQRLVSRAVNEQYAY